MAEKLVAEKREGTGKGVARKLAGRRPRARRPVRRRARLRALSVDARDLYHVLHTGAGATSWLTWSSTGRAPDHPARRPARSHPRPLHPRRLLAVRRDEKIHLSIPVRIVGDSVGVKAGGVVEHHLWELEVESLPGDVPEAIDADISALEIGMSLRVSDLAAPEGATILTNPEESVVAVQQPQMAVEVEEAEERRRGRGRRGRGRRGRGGRSRGRGRRGGRDPPSGPRARRPRRHDLARRGARQPRRALREDPSQPRLPRGRRARRPRGRAVPQGPVRLRRRLRAP